MLQTHDSAWRIPSATVAMPPLLRRGIFRSGKVDTIRERMSRVLVPHALTFDRTPRELDFSHSQVALSRASIIYVDYGSSDTRVSVDAPVIDRTILLRLSLTGTSRVGQGSEAVTVPTGHFFAINDALPFQSSFTGDLRQLIVKADARDIESALWRHIGYVGRHPIRFQPIAIPADSRARLLNRLLLDVVDDLNASDTLLRNPGLARHCEDMLFSAMLHTIPHNYSDALLQSATSPAAPYYVRRVEDFLHERACETITMDDLVRAAGCSARSLHAGFRRFRNTTPFAMLREIRLERARAHLLTAAANTSIADVANACGFTHLSKFSSYYKDKYGELPSKTRITGS